MPVVTNVINNELYKDSIIPKALIKGGKIKIRHYSTFEPVTTIIAGIYGNNIAVDLPQKLLDNNVMVGDNIVLIYFNEEVEYVLNGEILDITLIHPQQIKIKIENVEKYDNLRKHTRHSISLTSNIKKINSRETYFAVIKNISLVGVSLTCKVEFEMNSDFIIDIAVSKDTIVTFGGRIVRARKLSNFYEYGIIQTSIDEQNAEKLEKYIRLLQEEEESMFMNQ